MRRSIPGFLAVLLAASAVPGAAQTPPPAATSGFSEVQVDLGSRAFTRVLPFDIPFQITGTAPTGARTIEVQFSGSRRSVPPPPPPTAAADDLDAACAARNPADAAASPWQPVPALRWDRIDLVDTGATTTFRITVPPLEAERYYSFLFKILVDATPQQADAFQKKALPVLDEQFRKVSTLSLSPDQSKALRLALIQALREVLGPGDVAAEGTLFDPCTDHEVVRNGFNRDFLNVMRQQQQRNLISLSRLGDLQRQIKPRLDALRSPALVGLAGRVQAKAAADPTAAGSLQGAAGGDQLVGLDPGTATSLAAGLTADGAQNPNDLFTSMDPAAIDQFAANYGDTLQKLQGLESWIRGLLTPQPDAELFADAPAGDVEALQALIAPDGDLEQARQTADQLQSEAAALAGALRSRQAALQQMAGRYREQVAADVTVASSTTGNSDTFQGYYVSADLGFVYLPDIAEGVPYMGTNIYFRPVNKNVPLSQKSSFGRRFAITVGVTLDSIADDQGTRKDFTGQQSLVVGAGYRFTESLRFGLGAVVFVKQDPNPLVDDETTGVTPYISVSFDWNVAKTFKGLGSTLFANAN